MISSSQKNKSKIILKISKYSKWFKSWNTMSEGHQLLNHQIKNCSKKSVQWGLNYNCNIERCIKARSKDYNPKLCL